MSKQGPIVITSLVALGAGALFIWGAKTKDSVEKISLVVDSIKKKKLAIDHSVHTAKITLYNFSANALDINYPSIKVKHDGTDVGFSFPRVGGVHLTPKGKITIELDFRINQVQSILSLLTTPKLSFSLQIITNVNGVEVSQNVKYDLIQAKK